MSVPSVPAVIVDADRQAAFAATLVDEWVRAGVRAGSRGVVTPVAAGVSGYQLDAYQKTVRLLLMNPVITPNRPDRDALPAVREWAETLRSDLSETLGYRLEIGASHARLVRVFDLLDGSQPATVGTPPRPFDRVRLRRAKIDEAGDAFVVG